MRNVKRKVNSVPLRDPKKESILNELTALLRDAGFCVRREKLKTGPGWKVVSGSCRVQRDRLIFVDKRLSLDDQILFLASKLSSHNIKPDENRVSFLPENVLSKLKAIS